MLLKFKNKKMYDSVYQLNKDHKFIASFYIPEYPLSKS